MAIVIFSLVKITIFTCEDYRAYTRKLIWYFTGVYVIKLNLAISEGHQP